VAGRTRATVGTRLLGDLGCSLVDPVGELGEHGTLDDVPNLDREGPGPSNVADDYGDQQGVAADREEVVLAAYLGYSEYVTPDLCQPGLGRVHGIPIFVGTDVN
jgi:hypothetical protein